MDQRIAQHEIARAEQVGEHGHVRCVPANEHQRVLRADEPRELSLELRVQRTLARRDAACRDGGTVALGGLLCGERDRRVPRQPEVVVVREIEELPARHLRGCARHTLVHREIRIQRITRGCLGEPAGQGAVLGPLGDGHRVGVPLTLGRVRDVVGQLHAHAVHRIRKLPDGRGPPEERRIHPAPEMALEGHDEPCGGEGIESVVAQAGFRRRGRRRKLELIRQPLEDERERRRCHDFLHRHVECRSNRTIHSRGGLDPLRRQHRIKRRVAALLNVTDRIVRPRNG